MVPPRAKSHHLKLCRKGVTPELLEMAIKLKAAGLG